MGEESNEGWGRNHELISAACANDVAKIRELLGVGCNPSWPNQASRTPLHIAALWGHVESTEVLIQARADVNAADVLGGDTPLHVLLTKDEQTEKRLAICKLLMEARADATMINDAGCTPGDVTDISSLREAVGAPPLLLHDAVRSLDVPKLQETLARISRGELLSSMLDCMDGRGLTALHYACAAPHVTSTELLLEARASHEICTRDGWQMPLHVAAWSGSFLVVQLLLGAGADVHAYEPDQDHDWDFKSKSFAQDPEKHFTALHIAAQCGNVFMMRLLLEAKAEVNVRDSLDRTPLHLCLTSAAEGDLGPGVGVRVDGLKSRPERNGKLAAIIGPLEVDGKCAGCEDPDCGRYPVLVEDGPPEGILLKPVNVHAVYGEAVDLLLAARSDVNLGNRKIGMDSSPLHEAALRAQCDLARKFIAAGANVNMQRAGSGLAPLHMAIRGRKLDFIVMVLEARADANLAARGKTAYELAQANGIDLNLTGGGPKRTEQYSKPCRSFFETASEFERVALCLE